MYPQKYPRYPQRDARSRMGNLTTVMVAHTELQCTSMAGRLELGCEADVQAIRPTTDGPRRAARRMPRSCFSNVLAASPISSAMQLNGKVKSSSSMARASTHVASAQHYKVEYPAVHIRSGHAFGRASRARNVGTKCLIFEIQCQVIRAPACKHGCK